MPTRLAAKPKPPAVSRAALDAKLAEVYSVSPRTIRLWRRKNAPLDEPAEMRDWIADLRRQGKGDSVDVRAARIRKLRLQVEALELQEHKTSDTYVRHAELVRQIDPLCVFLRQSLRELLVVRQPLVLAQISSSDEMRVATTAQYDAWVADVRAFCARSKEAIEAANASQDASPVPVAAELPPSTSARSKPGRVADPEMEALRLRKLDLECQAIERTNRIERGELLGVDVVLPRLDGEFGGFRHAVRDLLTLGQPSTLSGRRQQEIATMNHKTYENLLRRLRSMQEKICAGGPKKEPQIHSPS